MRAVSLCYEQIPCEFEQGIVFIEQANFTAEQGLLCFSSRLERLGMPAPSLTAFQPHDPADSPDQPSDDLQDRF